MADDAHIEGFHACEDLVAWLEKPPEDTPEWSQRRWQLFCEASQVHAVAPLLRLRLQDSDWKGGPIRAWLEQQYLANRERVERMLGELGSILDLSVERGLDLMPLKGPVLIGLYGREADGRPLTDLDLLVRLEDMGAAEKILLELGYEKVVEGYRHHQFLKPDNRSVVDEACEHPDNPRPLELHCTLREHIGDDVLEFTSWMWSTARPAELLGKKTWVPAPAELWLHLLAHLMHHLLFNTFRLIQLLDLELVVSHVERPQELLGTVDARYTYPALSLIDRYYPSEVNRALLESQRPRVTGGFATWADSLSLYSASWLNPTSWRG